LAARVAANKYGYKNVKVLTVGVPGWSQAGYPVLARPQFVQTMLGYLVLVDTRPPAKVIKGYIQGAVNLSPADIKANRGGWPGDRRAFIVLYSDGTDLKKLAPLFETLKKRWYTNVAILEGGYQGWVKANRPTQKGKAQTRIFYLPRPRPGEVNREEFMAVVKLFERKKPPADYILLDVRSRPETTGGVLPGAINIPVDELTDNLKKLDKKKKVLTYCSTGLRAEMAYHILRNAGFNVQFLNDRVAVRGREFFCCFRR
jgi:rhodanese-related sulfurtransferase